MYANLAIRSRPLVFLLVAALGAGVAAADMNGGRASAAARHEVERAACLRGQSHQDRTTCLREAGAAFAQAKRNGPDDESEQALVANRLERCQRLSDELRRDCIARMQGQGTTSGSVAGGGIYRELVTIIKNGESSGRDD